MLHSRGVCCVITSKLIFYWDSKYVIQSVNRQCPICVLIHCTFDERFIREFYI